MSRAEISQGSLLRVVFCYATVRLFIAKREAAASPISGNAVEDQGKCRAYFICDAASKGTRARRRLQPKTKHLLRQQPKSNMCSCSAAQKPRLRTHWRKLKEERLPANLALDQPNCKARARNPRIHL